MQYQYDANGRMRSANRIEGGGVTTATYDGIGQRVQTALNGVTRNFVYNLAGQVVAEYRQGVLDRAYVYQGGALLASDEQPRSCTITTDQYVRNFYTGALARQPNAAELQQWTAAIDQALAQGYGAVLGEVRNLGTALFTSQEYLNRNRTNSEFIIDLYWGYLHRTYDQAGYDGWLAVLNGGATRDEVREGFALSPEFETKAGGICTTLGGTATVKYVFMDQQGSARTLLNGNGNVVARHDYLPFGEELWAGAGMRTSAQQYGPMDQSRNRYALTEKDEGTGLDHTWFRKYENNSGRWTSPDPLGGTIGNPQSFNRYAYTANDPINLVDPSGLAPGSPCVMGNGQPGIEGNDGKCYETPRATVEVTPEDDTTTLAFIENSQYGGYLPQNPVRLNDDQIDGARSDIASLLGVPRCANFMKGLLKRLGEITERDPYSTNPLIIFEEIARQGRLFLGSSSGGGSAGGTLEQGTADIRINGLDSGPFSAWMNGRRWLHEITHVASKTGAQYSHTDMAQAAYDVTRVGSRVPGNPRDSGWTLRDSAASTYFEARLFDACRRRY